MLRLLKMVTENAHKNGIWVGICGELGADLTLTETFLAIGVDELSVSPRAVLPLRNAVRMTDTRESAPACWPPSMPSTRKRCEGLYGGFVFLL